jgi:hypothetical protein
MLAYNTAHLKNRDLRTAAEEACRKGYIPEETLQTVKAQLPDPLYTPNMFVRIGLFLLTAIIQLAFAGLMLLMTDGNGVEGMLFITGLIAYGILEFFVRSGHYRSGVDDALLWGSIGFMYGSLLAMLSHVEGGTALWLLLPFLLLGIIRFKDTFCTALLLVNLAAIIVWYCSQMGDAGMAAAPFIVLVGSGLGLWMVVRSEKSWHHSLYSNCWHVAKSVLLLLLYAAGNVYMIGEVANHMDAPMPAGSPVATGFFWLWTVLIPFAYIGWGIRKKDRIILDAGLLLIAAVVFTVRYYYSIMPLEQVMVLGGLVLVSLAAWLIRYLKTPKKGFTYEVIPDDTPEWAKRQIESLIIAETMARPAAVAPEQGFEFGGGQSGGGGASSSY